MLRLCCLLFSLLLPLSVAAEAPKVLFDQGHRQGFVIEKDGPLQLSGFATLLQQQGWQVASSTQPLTAQALNGTDALIISGPFRSSSVRLRSCTDNFEGFDIINCYKIIMLNGFSCQTKNVCSSILDKNPR